LAPPKNSS